MCEMATNYRFNLYYIFYEDKQEHPPDLKRMEELKNKLTLEHDGYP